LEDNLFLNIVFYVVKDYNAHVYHKYASILSTQYKHESIKKSRIQNKVFIRKLEDNLFLNIVFYVVKDYNANVYHKYASILSTQYKHESIKKKSKSKQSFHSEDVEDFCTLCLSTFKLVVAL